MLLALGLLGDEILLLVNGSLVEQLDLHRIGRAIVGRPFVAEHVVVHLLGLVLLVGHGARLPVRRLLAVVALDLEGGVADAEAVGEEAFELAGLLLHVVEGQIAGHLHVGGEGHRLAAEGPEVDVVDTGDAGRTGEGGRDGGGVEVRWRPVEEDVARPADEVDGGEGGGRGDEERRDRIEAFPSGEGDADAGDEHGDGAAEVGQEVQAGGADGEGPVVVGAVRVGPSEQHERAGVHGDAEDTEHRHAQRADLDRVPQAVDRLPHEPGDAAEEHDAGHLRAEGVDAAPPERAARRWRTLREHRRPEGDEQADGVGPLVHGVGEHGDRPDHEPADDLGDAEAAVERGGQREATGARLGRGPRRVLVVVDCHCFQRATTAWTGMDQMPVSVAVVGSVNADLYLGLDRLPGAGDTMLASDARWRPGGKGANQAAAAARLGANARFVGAIGDDGAAEIALGGLAAAGVDLGAVRRIEGSPSGVAVVCVDVHGDNLIVVAPGANGALEPADVRIEAGTAAVLVSLEIPAATAAAALATARELGAIAVLNAAPADAASPAMVGAADVVIANEGEAAAVAGGRDLVALAADADAIVVATAGPAGVRAATPAGEELHVPALPADVIDTVGAGDCFAAALTVALAEGQDLDLALRFAVAAATLKVGRPGARATPTRDEVEALLATT